MGETVEPGMDEGTRRRTKMLVRFTGGIFLLLLVYALYFARDFFMPVVLSVLLALTFSPLNRWLMRRGLPAFLSAMLIVFTVVLVFGGLGYGLSGPISGLIKQAPDIADKIHTRLDDVSNSLIRVSEASKQVEKAASTASDPTVQKVTIAQPGILSRATGNLLSIGTTIVLTIVLTLFLLASGLLFYEKIIQSFQLLSDKKRALRIAHDVEREISRYLFTIFLINCGLGLCVGLALWLTGFPSPVVFGVIAAVVNFLPYVGAFAGVAAVALISVAHFATIGAALLPPLAYLALTTVEGQIVTPTVVGRRLEINAVAVFLAVAFWGWLWGVAGALMAVPLLVFVKVFCDHFDELRGFGNFLAIEQADPRPDDVLETRIEQGR
ncbi:AI-2E family transporter [Pararhizobium mangrovi]|uniref:AI-2E family transporter n=1 Tax=Pararhizobium mangrovi TaxID=2590452 RepID=UPI0015E856E3|nr:AI-2E family transporter [Pararhizobium mangrovi]